jgi:hypothetical protein
MSAHSSIARPFESFNEYRLLTTRLAFRPSSWDLLRGAIEGVATPLGDFFPIAALICFAFLAGDLQADKSGFKNGSAPRSTRVAIN